MQETLKGTRREERRFDTTQLCEARFGYRVHRDYMAHFFRWQFARRVVTRGQSVLDVGCGQDVPLLRALSEHGNVPSRYLGIDLNSVPRPPSRTWAKVLDRFDFVGRWAELKGPFDHGFCFEVIEHMDKTDGLELLRGLFGLCRRVYLSTPVFNGFAAANHVHEYTAAELREAIESVGFTVAHRWGTFGDTCDLYSVLSPEERATWDSMSGYYSTHALSVIFAPRHPDHCRNNLWELHS